MAEAEKKEHVKKGKKKPRHIITTRHDDGSYSHEHMHDGKPEKVFAGTSANLGDVQQHMADHFGSPAAAQGGEVEAEEPEAGASAGEQSGSGGE